jgi:hypothetical protein
MPVDLDGRALEFLHESNAIESIRNIDYRKAENARAGAGHVGAFLDSQERAQGKVLPTVEDVARWQGMLTEEQRAFGHDIPGEAVGRLRGPLVPINVRVGAHIAPDFNEVAGLMAQLFQDLHARFVPDSLFMPRLALAGDVFQRFEAIHPFVDGNGRTGRLLVNHLITMMNQPLMVFRADERPAFCAAHSSKKAMRLFLFEKTREAMYWVDGKVWVRKERYDFADRYVDPDSGREMVMECHELVAAAEAWR